MCLYNYLCVQYFEVQEIQHKKSPLEQTDGDVRKERCNVAYYLGYGKSIIQNVIIFLNEIGARS